MKNIFGRLLSNVRRTRRRDVTLDHDDGYSLASTAVSNVTPSIAASSNSPKSPLNGNIPCPANISLKELLFSWHLNPGILVEDNLSREHALFLSSIRNHEGALGFLTRHMQQPSQLKWISEDCGDSASVAIESEARDESEAQKSVDNSLRYIFDKVGDQNPIPPWLIPFQYELGSGHQLSINNHSHPTSLGVKRKSVGNKIH